MKSPINRQSDQIESRWRRALQRISWLEPCWVALMGGLLLLPPRFLPEVVQPYLTLYRPAVTILLFLFWPIRWLAYRQLTRRTPLDLPLLLLLLWLPVSFWASADKALSWEALSYLLFGVTLYLALINWPPAQQRPQIIGWSIVLIGIGLASIMPLLTDLDTGKIFRAPAIGLILQQFAARLPGSVNPDLIAGILVIVLPLPVALTISQDWSQRRWPRVLCGLAALFMLAMLVLTQSRGSYLAATIALALVFTLRWPRLVYALPILLLVSVIGVYFIATQTPNVILTAFEGRPEIWSRALYALSDFPFTGIGIGTWNRVIPVLYPLFTEGLGRDNAHNLLLQIGVDLGLPGLIAFLALLINTLAMLAQVLRQRIAAMDWAWAVGAVGGLTAMCLHGLSDVAVWNARPAFVMWLLVALSTQIGLRAVSRVSDLTTNSARSSSDQPIGS